MLGRKGVQGFVLIGLWLAFTSITGCGPQNTGYFVDPDHDPTKRKPQQQFTVLTLNAWFLPELLNVSRDISERLEEIPPAIVAVGADVIAFQEIWTTEARDNLISDFRK